MNEFGGNAKRHKLHISETTEKKKKHHRQNVQGARPLKDEVWVIQSWEILAIMSVYILKQI